MRLSEHVARIGEKKNAYRLLVGKPEGKRPLARPTIYASIEWSIPSNVSNLYTIDISSGLTNGLRTV
jgi:hypothetical protein